MSKFANAFSHLNKNSGVGSGMTAEERKKQNEALAEAFKTPKLVSRTGIVSGIIDLGIQKLEDGHILSKIPLEDEEAYMEENPGKYFKDVVNPNTKQTERHEFWPGEKQPCVAVTVDFPKHTFDWGGDIGVKPIRMLLNGEYTLPGTKAWEAVVSSKYSLKETTKDFGQGKWSLSKTNPLRKMAVSAGLIGDNEPFVRHRIGELIGKAFQFEVSITTRDGYLKEKISFKGAVPEDSNPPELDEDLMYYVVLDGENELSAIKQLRRAVKNTIAQSDSYEGSRLQKEFHAVMFPEYKKPEANNTGAEDDDTDDLDQSDSSLDVLDDDCPY